MLCLGYVQDPFFAVPDSWSQKALFALVLVAISGRVVYRLLSVREEQLLVIRDWGIQKKTTYWSGRAAYQFIDAPRIRSVVVNEAFQLHRVIFYVAFIVDNAPKLALAFEHLIPRLPALLEVYRGSRCLILGERETS